jgi:FHS family L-fucose permease-like MFS transporter
LACAKRVAYRRSVASLDGDEVRSAAIGMKGTSPEAPRQPVPGRWVRLKPRMRVTIDCSSAAAVFDMGAILIPVQLLATEPGGRAERETDRRAMAMAAVIFFMWGFLTSLNDVLVPHLKSVFALNYSRVMLVQFTFFGAYFVMSLPSGEVVSRFGYKLSIVIGLVVAAAGALLFYPAAARPSYPVFLTAFFTLASGITLLQVAANPYVSLLGPERTAASRLNLAQALNSLGTTLAPKIGGVIILSGAVLTTAQLMRLPDAEQTLYRGRQAELVQGPYVGLAVVLLTLAAGVYLFHLPAVAPYASAYDADASGGSFLEALRHRHLRLAVAAIFLYVGAEVAIGSFMISYISDPGIGAMSESRAAGFVALYWGGAMIGRFAGAALLQRADPRRLLAMSAAIAAALVATTVGTSGAIAIGSLVAVGLFNSIMFPNIFALGVERMGRLTGRASSLLIMAIVGGAIVPLAQGVLADAIGVHHAFLLPLACYLYVVYYGLRGANVQPV